MTYELAFDRRALKEWQKLGHTIRETIQKEAGRNGWKIHAYPQPGYMVMLIAIKSNFVHLATDLTYRKLKNQSIPLSTALCHVSLSAFSTTPVVFPLCMVRFFIP